MKPCRSARYVRLSTMRGASIHLAPSGRAGMRIGHDSRFGTSMVKAIDLPSGDQAMLEGLWSRWVICVSVREEAVLRSVRIHDPEGRTPAVVDFVHPAARVDDLLSIRGDSRVRHSFHVEVLFELQLLHGAGLCRKTHGPRDDAGNAEAKEYALHLNLPVVRHGL